MRVARIELEDIGPFDRAVLEIPEPHGPGEVVLIEGPNGSGKTTIAQLIAVMMAGAQYDTFDAAPLDPPDSLLRRRLRSREGQAQVVLEQDGQFSALKLDRQGTSFSLGTAETHTNPVRSKLVELHDAALSQRPTSWAAFALRGQAPTANLNARGPLPIEPSALDGALAFGSQGLSSPSGASILGQFLTNI